jgi:hypothetical protein
MARVLGPALCVVAALGASARAQAPTSVSPAEPPGTPPEAPGDRQDDDADDDAGELDSLPIEIHGFVSQGYIKSTGNNYLARSKTRGSFEFSEVGINLTKVLSDRLRLGVQLFARDLGPIGNYAAHFDWYYLDYQFADWLGIRAGRTKLPFGLYNEVSDIDAARVPVLLPQSIYPLATRDYLLAQTGLELYGFLPLAAAGGLEYRLYGGTIHVDLPVQSATARFRVESMVIPVLGGRVLWETPLPGLRLGGSGQALRIEYQFSGASLVEGMGVTRGLASADFDAKLWVGSIEYAGERLLLAGEYSRWYLDTKSSVPAQLPPADATSERYFVMGAFRATSWLTPGAYYSALFPNVKERKGKQNYQHDAAATLRFDLTRHWILKLEGHYMRGTADVNVALNDRLPRTEMVKNWAVFLAKTTVHF